LRRLQIKDLEARVEILSSDREERQELMSLLVRSLLAENAQLRKMVKTMAAFIGEGLATSLPRIGVTLEEMHEFLIRPETESVHAAYQALKEARAKEASGELKLGAGTAGGALDLSLMFKGVGETSASGSKRKRSSMAIPSSLAAAGSTPDPSEAKRSRTRSSNGATIADTHADARDIKPSENSQMNGQSPVVVSPLNEVGVPPFRQDHIFAQQQQRNQPTHPSSMMGPAPQGYMPLQDFVQYSQGPPNENSMGYSGPPHMQMPPNMPQYPPQPIPPYSGQYGPGMQSLPVGPVGNMPTADMVRTASNENPLGAGNPSWPGSGGPVEAPMQTGQMLDDNKASWDDILKMQASMVEQGGKKWEAIQLITYHMENYRQNPNYHLPPSLTPTRIQRTIAHEHLIDGIIIPSLRDQLILMRGKYNILKVFKDLCASFEIPGEDPLDYRNWELSEEWMIKHFILVNRELIATCNRWRAQRGDRLLDYDELKREAQARGTAGATK